MNESLSSRRLLAVLAHPDDESFGPGGTLALYAQRGVEVHLVCATRGEAGEVEPHHLEGHDSVAGLREQELLCAANILSLAGVHFLDYRDSGMPGSADNQHPQALVNAPQEEVARRIACWIRQVRPQVVITFDPIGGYRHPDHIAIHRACVLAFNMASDPDIILEALPPYQPERLYFFTIPRRFLRLAVRLLPLTGKDPSKWGRNQDIDLTQLAADDFPVHAVIDYSSVAHLKLQASACHASQGGPMMSGGVMGWLRRLGGAKETYMRAIPPPKPGEKESDLFAAVKPSL